MRNPFVSVQQSGSRTLPVCVSPASKHRPTRRNRCCQRDGGGTVVKSNFRHVLVVRTPEVTLHFALQHYAPNSATTNRQRVVFTFWPFSVSFRSGTSPYNQNTRNVFVAYRIGTSCPCNANIIVFVVCTVRGKPWSQCTFRTTRLHRQGDFSLEDGINIPPMRIGHKLPNRSVRLVTTFVTVTEEPSLTPQPKWLTSTPSWVSVWGCKTGYFYCVHNDCTYENICFPFYISVPQLTILPSRLPTLIYSSILLHNQF